MKGKAQGCGCEGSKGWSKGGKGEWRDCDDGGIGNRA